MNSNVIKNFRSFVLPLAAGACVTLTGCQLFEVHSSRTDADFIWDYCSANPETADRALTIYRNTYEGRQNWSYKVKGYDDLYAVTDARQMEVNEVLNRPAFVEIYYSSATNHLALAAVSNGTPAKTWTKADVKAIADQADAGLDVRWKK